MCMGEDGIDEAVDACRDVWLWESKLPQLRNEAVATFPFREPMLRRSEGHGEIATAIDIGTSLYTRVQNASRFVPKCLLVSVDVSQTLSQNSRDWA